MTSVVAANWAGAYKFADDITKQVNEEAKEGWVDSPMPYPSTWPFRLEQQNGVAQGVKDDGTTKVRRSTDKGFGEDSVNECIELVAKLKLCTNLQIGKAAAIIATADAGERTAPNADEDPDDPATIADDCRTYLWKIDLTAAYRQITIHQLYLWMCHTSWNGEVYLDRRMQFGDKSAVEGFQSVTNLILTAVQQAIDGNQAVRDLVPAAAHLWQYVDVRPTHPEYLQWERERIGELGEGTQLRLNHTDGYIDDFMGSAHGRRRAFAIAAIHRAFIGKTGANFPLKASKECLPAPSMTALGGLLDVDAKLATLSAERAEKYSAQAALILNEQRFDEKEFHRFASRLMSAAQYEPAGRAWLVSCYVALKQAWKRKRQRGKRVKVFIGPGVKQEARFWIARLKHPAGVALFPRFSFPPSDSPDHRVGWFDASTSWGMGGAFLVRRGANVIAFFYVYEWSEKERGWHVNVFEAVAGLTLLVTGHIASPAPFVSEFGDNNAANASAYRNATPNLQIARVLQKRADFVTDNRVATRQFRVSTDDNVLGDPLSRGPRYMSKFKEAARAMGATSFVRMPIPPLITSLMADLEEIFPEVERMERENREERAERPPRSRRSPSPSRSPVPTKRSPTLSDMGISRNRWRYVASFAGLDTMMDVAANLGGSPACGSDNKGLVRALWQQRSGRVCFADFKTYSAMLRDPELRAQHMHRVLVYVSGPPCIDFSIAGGQRGTDGNTGQLFLDDVEGALETDAPIVISEIVLGILDEHLVTFLHQKVKRLASKYVVRWRVLRCNQHGDRFSNRRRIFIVGIKRVFLREGVDADTVDLFPPARPANESAGLREIIDPAADGDESLRFTDGARIEWLPPREIPDGYDGLRLLARVDGSDRIGHHIYDYNGAAATIRTDGDGPGLATGLYIINGLCRRLSYREAARTHTIPETTIDTMEQFINRAVTEPSRREKELMRLIGNSIPVMTLNSVVSHLLSLLNW